MFKLNLKIAWRNLLKNRIYTGINVLGLALGLAGFIFILLYVNHEKSYDHWDEQLKDVYQVQEIDHWEIKDGKEIWMGEADKRLVNLFKESLPQVEEITQLKSLGNPRSVILPNTEPFLQYNISVASPTFFAVFPFKFVYGDASTAFNKPESIVIKEQFAKTHFGHVNPVGKVIQINEQNWTTPEYFTITGVVAEPETPSSVNFEILQYWEQHEASDDVNSYGETYVKTNKTAVIGVLNQTAKSLYFPFKTALLKRQKQPIEQFMVNGVKPDIRIVPLQEIHHQPITGKSWFDLIKPVILLSTLLLLISIINFVNMFTAQAVSRAKEVGIKKVIGAKRKSLIIQYLSETALQCIIALFLSIILLEGFLPYLNQIFNLSLSFLINTQGVIICIELIGLLILVTLLAGCYPAFVISSYQPQVVLKGNFSNSKKGKSLRSALVGLQFVIAVGFFIGILVISKQMKFMESRDPGFDANAVININAKGDKTLVTQIKAIDGVQYVGSNNGMISRNQRMTGKYKYNNESNELNTVLVNFEGLQALGVTLIKGRLFNSSNLRDSLNTVILNEALEKKYGGDMLGKYILVDDSIPTQVVGIIKDIQISGFEDLILPTVYTAAKNNATGYPNKNGVNYVIKFDAQKQKKILASIDQLWKRHYPTYPLTYTFINDDLAKVLIAHQRFKKMLELFSFLSISLSLIGLFSLAAFLTKQRTKEIAIRKILGADNREIFILLNKGYIGLMLIANVVSWPLIYIATDYWLKGFAYRIDVPVLPFVFAFIVSIIITIITVSIQVKNAVKANPINALKYE